MRKIIFRGCRPNGQWIFGDLRQYQSGARAVKSNTFVSIAEVIPETVGQYTGIRDKNGVMIYEGDIIRAMLPETKGSREFSWPLMSVAFGEGAFGVWQSQGSFTPLRSFSPNVTFEVVGNVHENKDLIGGQA